MIADGHGVVLEEAHGAHHWIAHGAPTGLVDAFERRALNGVATIDEECVGVGGAHLSYEGGDFGEAAVGGPGGDVVDGGEVAVEVGGDEDGDGDLRCGREGGDGEQE